MSSNYSREAYSLDNFGPAKPGRFDFTPLFQDTLLSIVPSTLLLIAIAGRLLILRNRSQKVLKNALHGNKLVSLVFRICS